MDIVSNMVDGLNERIAERVRELRAASGLSLDALATKCGVSRSMISLVERGESSPTAVLLAKLAIGLGVTLAALFDPPATAQKNTGPLARRADQPEWRDPGSGYLRRNVSPAGTSQSLQIWLLEGSMVITAGKERYRLQKGDCVAMQLDRPTMFHNPARKPARYAVVIASEPVARRP